MKVKLHLFSDFAARIFPHECLYLEQTCRFEDEEKLKIFQILCNNARTSEKSQSYDPGIDKRKYSFVKYRVKAVLEAMDVDRIFKKLNDFEYCVLTDSVKTVDEKEMLRMFRQSDASGFHFIKLYEVGRAYRHYLQIRLRKKDFDAVQQFLEKYHSNYDFARLTNDKLQQATRDIIAQYYERKGDAAVWEQWLRSIYFDESLDGYTRILAWIRLIFIGYNYRRYDLIRETFDYFETMLAKGSFYSRRILANYYSQQLLYHAGTGDLEMAARYGYLSIKEQNDDYLYYVNNLAYILLRKRSAIAALELLKSASAQASAATNFHNKVGHAAYLILANLDCGFERQAENHGDVFLKAYRSEILEYRWHLFFSAYFKVVLYRKNYRKLIRAYKHCHLQTKDEQYKSHDNYTPVIPWMYHLACYGEDLTEKPALLQSLKNLLTEYNLNRRQAIQDSFMNVLEITRHCFPELTHSAEWAEIQKN
jgi:hypothetical protein